MLLEGQPCATKCEKCEKDAKVYVERSERSFEQVLPKCFPISS